MTSRPTLEDQPQPKVSKEPLATWEINLLTRVIFELNKHDNEKRCKHTVKNFAKDMAEQFGAVEQ